MNLFKESDEIKTLDEKTALAIARGALEPEDVRWAARRRMAVWSWRFLCLLSMVILGYGIFAPEGVATINALLGVITFIFGVFTSIIGGYFGVDWKSNKKASQNKP